MKKVVYLIGILLILSGCSSKKLEADYNKMQAGDKGINGYNIDLRIYGDYDNERINEAIKIKNYNDTKYEVTLVNLNINKSNSKDNVDKIEERKNEVIYVTDGKTYTALENGQYSLTNEDVKYNSPSLYLEGLNNVSKINKTAEEKIGAIKYVVYDVTYNQKFIYDLISDTNVSNLKITNDVTGKIYLDEEGYVNRIIYNIEGITINVNYYGINKSSDIILPGEIDEEV